VLVAVRDAGPGLDPKRVDRLFETFYTTKLGGMGWAWRSAGRSSRRTGDGCGPAQIKRGVPSFSSACLQNGMRPFPPSTPARCRRCERMERRLLSRSLASAAPTQMIQIFHRRRDTFATAGYWNCACTGRNGGSVVLSTTSMIRRRFKTRRPKAARIGAGKPTEFCRVGPFHR
jgi:hypothetical protein